MSTAWLFDQYASRYDEWYSRHPGIAASELDTIRKLMPRSGVGLEVGVGTGFFASKLGVLFGVDPSIEMLAYAHHRGVWVVQGIGEALPIRSSSLTYVLIVVTLCFADNPDALLKETWRVLMPCGVAITCIVPRDSVWGEYYQQRARSGHPIYAAARFYTLKELEKMALSAGFVVEERLATLTYTPWEEERYEKPSTSVDGRGFVCLRLRKACR